MAIGKKRRNEFRRQAKTEGFLRYNPERSSLKGALKDAAAQRKQAISAANSTARGVTAAAKAARPVLRKQYGETLGSVQQASADADKILSTLAPDAHRDLASGFAARDVQGTKIKLAETLAGAIKETTQRIGEAQSGRAWAINAANAAYRGDTGKVRERLRQVGREEGAFRQGRYGELTGEQRKLQNENRQKAADRRNSRLTSGVDAQGRIRKGGPKDPAVTGKDKKVGGAKEATGDSYGKFSSNVERALRTANTLKKDLSRGELYSLLVNGRDARTIVDEKKYDALIKAGASESAAKRKASQTIPAVKAVPDALAVTAALDVAFDTRISRTTARKIRSQRHIRPVKLGYDIGPTPKAKPAMGPALKRAGRGMHRVGA